MEFAAKLGQAALFLLLIAVVRLGVPMHCVAQGDVELFRTVHDPLPIPATDHKLLPLGYRSADCYDYCCSWARRSSRCFTATFYNGVLRRMLPRFIRGLKNTAASPTQ